MDQICAKYTKHRSTAKLVDFGEKINLDCPNKEYNYAEGIGGFKHRRPHTSEINRQQKPKTRKNKVKLCVKLSVLPFHTKMDNLWDKKQVKEDLHRVIVD